MPIAARSARPRTFLALAATALSLLSPVQAWADGPPDCEPLSLVASGGGPWQHPSTIVALSGVCLSPNGDLTADDVTISAGLAYDTYPRRLRITIRDQSGERVRSMTADGPSAQTAWDGNSTAGQRVADGDYSVEMQVECGGPLIWGGPSLNLCVEPPTGDPSPVEAVISKVDPRRTPPNAETNPTTCRYVTGDSGSLRQDVWSGWSFRPGEVPTGRTWAQVQLRNHPTSDGTVSWDDVGFYAIGE